MSRIGEFWRSSLGQKAVMAVSGIILFGFVLVHMIGNLKLYFPAYTSGEHAGEPALDVYGVWLRGMGSPALPEESLLWIARLVLLTAAVAHVWAAWAVTRRSRTARSKRYETVDRVEVDYAARTMRWGGVIVLLFIVYHILHFTTGDLHFHGFEHGEVFDNVVNAFSVWWVSAIYIVANLLLGLHLYHGLWSMFQSLGWSRPGFNSWRRTFAATFAIVITVGNLSFPLAVLIGLVG